MLIFLIFRAEAYTCWSARFARSVLVVLRVYLNRFRFFSDSGIFFIFPVFFGSYQSFGAFYHEKTLFSAISSDFGVFSHLWLFIVNGRLFIMKKTLFSAISSNFGILSFQVICGFGNRTGGFV